MDVVRRERRREQPRHELAHLVGLEVLAGFDGGAAGVRRREPLQPIGEPAESPAREIGDELSEAAGRIEAGMRIRRRVHHHRAPRERLHLVTHATEQLAVRVDRLELGRRELERQWQQEPLGRRPVARELAHRPLVQHPFVRGVLVHDRDARVGLEHDVAVEDLKQRRGSELGARGSGVAGEHLERHSGAPCRSPSPEPRFPSPQWRRRHEGTQRGPHRLLHDLLDEELVAEAHLELRRVDVHVHRVPRELQKQDERRAVARRNRGAVAGLRGAQHERIADRPATHEHVALSARRLRLRRALCEASHFERALAVRDRQERAGQLGAPQRMDPVDGTCGGTDVDQGTIVAREGEGHVGTREREQRHHLDGGTGLRSLRPQELAPGGRIEEQPAHRDRRPPLPRGVVHALALAARDAQAGSHMAVR